MKRLLALFLLLCLLPLAGLAEDSYVINRTDNLTEEYVFEEDTPILEIVFPRVYSSDCAIIRFGDETMMIDASTKNKTMRARIQSAMDSMGVDHIDVAYNSHPHDDHIDGFQFVHEYAPLGKLFIAFPEDYDARMKEAVKYCNANGIPIEHVEDGDVLTMGENDEVTMTVIQRWGTSSWDANDQSAMLLIRYGERTILFTGDVENRAETDYAANPPACGLDADILKYPHHGQQPLQDGFLEAISPELAFMNGAADVMNGGKKYLDKHGVPYLLGYKGLTRMRTDGQVWVVDYMYELNPDREIIQPDYQ
ncbi:MAG: MBL fold metallo-hydrolase [Clostridia bacterium]|nr:MBL fold metallo-hydrolase [Clostridia bacterium]